MMPIGNEVYNVDNLSLLGRGLEYTEEHYNHAIKCVVPILKDTRGIAELNAQLSDLAATEFSNKNLERLLTVSSDYEDWRVGEAMAEAYLTDHLNCEFPWPGGRDLKNPNSSPTGCDLVGFQEKNSSIRFAFGEVKTSSQDQYPPTVVSSRHGLAEQIESLRKDTRIKDALVRYLGFHSVNTTWVDKYKAAAAEYLNDDCNISLFGFLIRDVPSNLLDLRAKARKLSLDCPSNTSIELRALYIPLDKIKNFSGDLAKLAG